MTIPDKLVKKAIRDYRSTKSVHKTAKRCGLGSTTVHRILKANGITCDGLQLYRRRIKKLPEGHVLLEEYNSGESVNALARKYACNASSVNEALKVAGAVMRPRGNWERVITASEARAIAKQYSELGSQMAVAVLRNTSQIRVSRALRMQGIECGRMSGENHPSWRGGRSVTPHGYVQVRIPMSDPMRCMAQTNGYIPEHRLVMARALGRPLHKHESVHHIDGNRSNNTVENLQLRIGKHGTGVALKCRCCGSTDIIPAELH